MRVGYSIIADKRRGEWVGQLAASLPDPFISWERGGGVWDTAYRAWDNWVGVDVDWVVVLEDDAILCPGFVELVPQALRMLGHHQPPIPHSPISFYLGSTRPEPAGVTWAVRNHPEAPFYTHYRINHGVAIGMPAYLIGEVLEEADKRNITEYPFKLSKWFEMNRIRCWYTNPSLVDHRDMGSLVWGDRGRVGKPRRAHRVLKEGEKINWTGNVVKLPRE